MRPSLASIAVVLAAVLAGCAGGEPSYRINRAALDVPVREVAEAWMSVEQVADQIDSLASWLDRNGHMLLLATAKETNRVVLYDAESGERLGEMGVADDGSGQLSRPNGIAVAGDFAFVVERGARQVSVFDIDTRQRIASFGAGELRFPYGIYLETIDVDRYRAYVTDSDRGADLEMPPADVIARRVHEFSLHLPNRQLATVHHVRAFGSTELPGALRMVESIHGDPGNDRLLVAEEYADAGQVLKVYNFGGGFRDELVGQGIFAFQPEGIALMACDDGSGVWIASDQNDRRQRFHLFDRATLAHVASFSGTRVRSTDGIWFEPRPFGRFAHGALFAQHDDRAVAAFDWAEIARATGVPADCGAPGRAAGP